MAGFNAIAFNTAPLNSGLSQDFIHSRSVFVPITFDVRFMVDALHLSTLAAGVPIFCGGYLWWAPTPH